MSGINVPNSSCPVPVAQYNGNISAMKWKTKTLEAEPYETYQNMYVYRYDNLNRMTAGYYVASSPDLTNQDVFDQHINWFNEEVTYAASGNILELKRNGANFDTETYELMDDPQKLWITFIGYENGNKVFKSVDGGSNWTNVSGTLPNIPVNCIAYQNGSPDALYIGTDFGVFYRDSTMNDWIPFDTGLPNCIVSELEIHYGSQKIRAATYGRGLWESDLGYEVGVSEHSQEISFSIYPNPFTGRFTVNANAAKQFQITISNQLGEKIYERDIVSPKTEINLSSQPNGIYFLQLRSDSWVHAEKLIISR